MDPRLDIALLAAISHIKQNRVWCGMLGVGCYGGHVDGGVDSWPEDGVGFLVG